jgi:hypothetical protein
MKKIFTTIAMAVMAVTAFAQANQQYFRVEFTVPITGDKIPVGQSNNSVSATMKDEYTFCNPEHDYLDFQAQNPMGFRTTTSNITENSSFYLENGRTGQTPGVVLKYPYMVDKIKKMTATPFPSRPSPATQRPLMSTCFTVATSRLLATASSRSR